MDGAPAMARRRTAATADDAAGTETAALQGFWRTVRRAAGRIPFMDEVVAAYYCAMDRETPLKAKMILFGALGYFILPADTIPDFVFALGFTDDIAVLTAAIGAARAYVTPAHRLAARNALDAMRDA